MFILQLFQNLKIFQTICVGISIVSTLCFFITGSCGKVVELKFDVSKEKLLFENDQHCSKNDENKFNLKYNWNVILKLSKELFLAEDFLRVVFTNFIHTARLFLFKIFFLQLFFKLLMFTVCF